MSIIRTIILALVVTLLAACGSTSTTVVGGPNSSAAACLVPNVVGFDQNVAVTAISALGLKPVKDMQPNSTAPANTVVSQKPAAGTKIDPCQGEVIIAVSAGGQGAAVTPDATRSGSLNTPMPSGQPGNILFADDFEKGIKPDWGMTGSGFASVNGRLTLEKGNFSSAILGDARWVNYIVKFTGPQDSWQIAVHIQDNNNYMLLACQSGYCKWSKVVNGVQQEIPRGSFGVNNGADLDLKIEGNVYSLSERGNQVFYFADETFANGGLQLSSNSPFYLGAFEVTALP